MSPSIDIPPDLLGMFKQQESPLPASAAADLEMLCAALDTLQAGAQTDLNALASCLSRLSEWLKNQPEAAPDDVSGWTSELFGVKGMGGMLTCHSDRWEVIFHQDGSGQPYMGMWQSRLPEESNRGGLFKIQVGDEGTQLVLECARPLQVSLSGFGTAVWGVMDAFYQGLDSRRLPNLPVAHPPSQKLHVSPSAPKILGVEPSVDATPSILDKPSKRQTPPVPLPSENVERETAPGEQPVVNQPETWKCACGNTNTGEFCPKCGTKKSVPVVEQKNTPIQPAFCRHCGGVLSAGARFCRNCGTKVQG